MLTEGTGVKAAECCRPDHQRLNRQTTKHRGKEILIAPLKTHQLRIHKGLTLELHRENHGQQLVP